MFPDGSDSDLFQSTHPHGVRLYMCSRGLTPAFGFNPRTRMGCDDTILTGNLYLSSFNPRTRMGCDDAFNPLTGANLGFNPRTRMGCDLLTHRRLQTQTSFNPRTRMGCDQRSGSRST